MEIEHENLVTPDKHNLDVEWEKQPRLYLEYSQKLAKAKRDLDILKANLDLERASIGRNIREDPAKYDFALFGLGVFEAARVQ